VISVISGNCKLTFSSQMRHGNAFSRNCSSVSVCPCCDFQMPLPRRFVFSVVVQLLNIYHIEFQGYKDGVRVKVTATRKFLAKPTLVLCSVRRLLQLQSHFI